VGKNPTDPMDETEAVVCAQALQDIALATRKLTGLLTLFAVAPGAKVKDLPAHQAEISELLDNVERAANMLKLEML
jgi:hypothetical protein